MADRDDYRELLGQRLEAAHKVSTHIKEEPSGKEVLRWIETAKRKKHKRRMHLLSNMAAVFAIMMCVTVVVVIVPPEAEAGGKGGISSSYIQDQEGSLGVEKYSSVEALPQDLRDIYIMFSLFPEGFELSEIRIIQSGKKQECVIDIRCGEELIRINQFNTSDSAVSETVIRKGEKDEWGIEDKYDVYINTYEYPEKETAYLLECQGKIVSIICSGDVPRESIKNMVEKAIG